MILRRYGNTIQSVDPNFDARALTEIGFRRNGSFSIPTDEFLETHRKVTEHALTAESEGWVQDAAEGELLRRLEETLREVEGQLGAQEVLLVESESGTDHPKTRDEKRNEIVEGENRLYFLWRIEPPLRVGVYRRNS